ncbi:hypothetical protein AB0E59_31960 [Lentzea sp. NPDC034063]|uniref:protein-tyrosine phosphatase family protein n=1 Tax=unclassified Lentzea TaxID=2643253 RepID=UPI0033C2EF4D
MKDRHWRTEYRVGPFVVWATSLDSEERRRGAASAEPADVGLYLDERWYGHADARNRWFVPWEQLRAPDDVDVLVERLADVVLALRGGATVEVACFAGHGRTGSVLASLDIALGAEPAAAVARVREQYCGRAIGTEELEEFVHRVPALLAARGPQSTSDVIEGVS